VTNNEQEVNEEGKDHDSQEDEDEDDDDDDNMYGEYDEEIDYGNEEAGEDES
jgi:hypothetical protein